MSANGTRQRNQQDVGKLKADLPPGRREGVDGGLQSLNHALNKMVET
jgi:hypothetical protein